MTDKEVRFNTVCLHDIRLRVGDRSLELIDHSAIKRTALIQNNGWKPGGSGCRGELIFASAIECSQSGVDRHSAVACSAAKLDQILSRTSDGHCLHERKKSDGIAHPLFTRPRPCTVRKTDPAKPPKGVQPASALRKY